MRWFLLLILGISIISCDNKLWDGYSKTNSGLYYKIHKLGDGEVKPQVGDQVFAEINIWNEEQELMYSNGMQSGSLIGVKIGQINNASVSEAISLLHVGDSASLYFPQEIDIKKLTGNNLKLWVNDYRFDIKLNKIAGLDTKPIEKVDFEMDELKALGEFLIQKKINPKRHVQGVYLKTLKKGSGPKAQSSQNVVIHYSGKFLNGKEFDNTRRYAQPLEFQLGKPDQVIMAIEIALHHINVGGIIQVVSPSQYAFGAKGSSSGIIPPFTSVVYEIELLEVR
ncbi:MAG: FKBP-type peptidyl-prolyl cis-trans isomerase [Salibacteraceae bacterium]